MTRYEPDILNKQKLIWNNLQFLLQLDSGILSAHHSGRNLKRIGQPNKCHAANANIICHYHYHCASTSIRASLVNIGWILFIIIRKFHLVVLEKDSQFCHHHLALISSSIIIIIIVIGNNHNPDDNHTNLIHPHHSQAAIEAGLFAILVW